MTTSIEPRRRRGRPYKLITKKFADMAKRLGIAPPSRARRIEMLDEHMARQAVDALRAYRIERAGRPPRPDPTQPDWPYAVPLAMMFFIRLDRRPQRETAADVGVGQGRISQWKRSRRVTAAMDRAICASCTVGSQQPVEFENPFSLFMDPVWG